MEFDSIRIKVSEFYRKCKNPRLKCCFWYFIDKIVLGDFLFSHFFPQIFALWKKIQKCLNVETQFCIFMQFSPNYAFSSQKSSISYIFFLTSFKFAWKSVWSDIISYETRKCERKKGTQQNPKNVILPSATGYVQYTMTSFATQQFQQKVFVVFGARASVTNKYFPYFGRTSIRILVTICFAWNTLKTCMDYTVSNHVCFVLFLFYFTQTHDFFAQVRFTQFFLYIITFGI